MVDEGELLRLIEECGLSEVAAAIVAAMRPAFRLQVDRVAGEELEVGASRFGGAPDLHPEMSWPNGLPFLAQIRLSELPQMPDRSALPPRGMLWFFYALAGDSWGSNAADHASFAVLFSEHEQGLVRTSPPLAAVDAARQAGVKTTPPFHPVRLRFEPQMTLPMEQFLATVPGLNGEAYLELLCRLYGKDGPWHRLLGHPVEIQGDMTFNCEVGRFGRPLDQVEPYARDWRLLLQLDSDPAGLGWSWGDAGSLYFWIKEQDLRERVFSRAWYILQCF